MGEYEKAKDFYERAIEIETRTFGLDHVDIAAMYNNLGSVYRDMGEYEKAKDFYERAIELETKAFGPDHVNIATTYNNLGLVYRDMGEYEKAKDFYERAMKIETKAFGPDHVNIATTYNNLGSVYRDMGEYEKAKDFYERTIEIKTKAFGPDHVNIATTYNNLGLVYRDMGEYEKAKDFYERAMKIETKAFGPDHVNIATTYNNLGLVYRDMGEYEKAKDFYERAIEIETRTFGPDHVNIATTYNNLGLVYRDMGEYEKAKDFYERAMKIETKAFGPDHVNIATTYNNLGLVYRDMGEYEKAKDFYERAIEIETRTFGPDHVDIAAMYNNLGSVYRDMGEYEKARDFYECAIEIQAKAFEPDDVYIATTYNNLCSVYYNMGEYEKAKDFYERAMKILTNLIGADEKNMGLFIKATKDLDLTVDTVKKHYVPPIDDVKNNDDFFIKNFLNEHNDIRDEILDKLKSFSWICGGYGVRWKPRLSLFVTVAAERQNDEDALRKEIDETFGWKASHYFEFIPEPQEKSQFRWSQDIEVIKREKGPNPTRGNIEDECETKAQGLPDHYASFKDDSNEESSIDVNPGYSTSKKYSRHKSNDDRLFEEMFLDKRFAIRKDVRMKLKSLPWMRGEYGKVGPNEKIPCLHLFITVDYDNGDFDEDILKNEINKNFEHYALRYFEFRPKPSTTPKLQLLSKIEVGSNNGTVSRGTLTMFCCHNGIHYALTCCHVCYNGDGVDTLYEMQNQNKNDPNKFKLHLNTNQYNYTSPPSPLGHFNSYNLEKNTDILSIEVNGNVLETVDCRRRGIQNPTWNGVWEELHERVNIARELVEVKKYDNRRLKGEIVNDSYSCYDPENRIDIDDAVLVQCDETFLEKGESGVLVYFHDEDGRRIPFCYGVGAYYYEKICDPEYEYCLCFKLDIALENLFGEENCGCFHECANDV
ncbi:uncharacterized protein LOC124441248 isoform X6 [Xenia sp. Carnegie-2017]|uniref:uncharacterized protein LOC124441248 isoform X6 n=1 Tax=Xenia sp. Carnegie-2017 TaxID=2897299 RepID=UPI001F04DA8A|nr:uncharacterized protein LOC124441248 isoform X6 [Xenia sp. Carnegie-2017]